MCMYVGMSVSVYEGVTVCVIVVGVHALCVCLCVSR